MAHLLKKAFSLSIEIFLEKSAGSVQCIFCEAPKLLWKFIHIYEDYQHLNVCEIMMKFHEFLLIVKVSIVT